MANCNQILQFSARPFSVLNIYPQGSRHAPNLPAQNHNGNTELLFVET